MHLLAFEATPTRFAGGQERSLFEVVTGLAERGLRVSLAYQHEGDLLPEYERVCAGTYRLPSRVFHPRHVVPFALDLARGARIIRRAGIDALYANQYFDLPFVAGLGGLARRPVVGHLRIEAPHYLSRQYRWGLNRAARLIANSHSTRAGYVAAGIDPDRISVVHNAVDVCAFQPGQRIASAGRELLFLGRLSEQKGIDVLIDALAIARATRPELCLKVHAAVRGPETDVTYLSRLKQRVSDLGLDDAVIFLPHIAEPAEALRRADLLIVPSRYEPFGRVLLEAMACEVPVVATAVGGIPEVLGGGFAEHLVPPEDPRALASAILRLVDWRERDPSLGARSREHVARNFSRDRLLDQLEAVFRAAVLDRARRRG